MHGLLGIRKVSSVFGRGSVTWLMRIAAVSLLVSACPTGQPPSNAGTEASNTMPVSSPAISGIDNTVSVTMALADSFDVLPNGKCAGRSVNIGVSDGARAQLRGDTDGGSVWSVATARIERRPPLTDDDGLYCVVKVVFAPTRPDPKVATPLSL